MQQFQSVSHVSASFNFASKSVLAMMLLVAISHITTGAEKKTSTLGISGNWKTIGEFPATIKIVQTNDKVEATCAFRVRTGEEVRWRLNGTIKEGLIICRLVHLKAPKGWKNMQVHAAILTQDGNTIKG